jgi:MoxR-like ATPase
MSSETTYTAAAAQVEAILDEVSKAVVGKREAAELVLTGLLAGGHVLVEDVPGVAKTLLVRSIGRVSGLSFSRIQFTPDLMPADVTGSSVYDTRTVSLEFRPGLPRHRQPCSRRCRSGR